MAIVNWKISGAEPIDIKISHGWFSGKVKIYINSNLVNEGGQYKDVGGTYTIQHKNKKIRVNIKSKGLSWEYTLEHFE